jgi:SOS response regulatory protein OraA/RecX
MELSRHARQQLRERNIEPELVQETVENPDQIVATGRNKRIAQKRYQREGKDFLLRVVFSEGDNPEIITAYWTSRVSRYWRA